MGVKNLWDILESCKKTLPLHHLQNKRVCIDLSCWVVQLQSVTRSHGAMTGKPYLKVLFHRLRALLALNCSLIFVADGSIPAIKLATYRQRLKSGAKVSQDEMNSEKVCSMRRNMGSEFSRMIREAKVLGLALGIPCLDGIEEAEAQCALLNSESLMDVSLQTLMCFFLEQRPCTETFSLVCRWSLLLLEIFMIIFLGEGGHVVCYEMTDIERDLGFGRNSLITLALLLGSDYSQGVHGLGPESACHVVKSVGDNNILQQVVSQGLSFLKKTKISKKHGGTLDCNKKPSSSDPEVDFRVGNDNVQEKQNQFLQVIDAYLNPKCHSADSDAVYRVLAQHPFQRAELQEICAQFFEWPPEKTDEYILPRIAERDLHRFANLHSTSAQLGVNPCPYEMPVKCPVSEIIKTRKVQGRECFEVLWEGLDGLKTCILPADLIESACPEKIAEFEERGALRNRQNHQKRRPKTSEKISAMPDINSKLQTLLVDTELGSDTANCSASFRTTIKISETRTASTAVNFRNQDLLNAMSETSTGANAITSRYHGGASIAKNEVIDLLSPSPPRRNHTVSRYQGNDPRIDIRYQGNDPRIDMIDVSESESETSPEHARKARELRVFLASIRDEIS